MVRTWQRRRPNGEPPPVKELFDALIKAQRNDTAQILLDEGKLSCSINGINFVTKNKCTVTHRIGASKNIKHAF